MAHVRKVHKKISSTCYSQHLDSGYSGVQEHDAIVCCYSHCQQLQKSRSIHGKMSLPSIRLELYLLDWFRTFICGSLKHWLHMYGILHPWESKWIDHFKPLQLFALLHPGPFPTWSVLCEKVTHRHGMLRVANGLRRSDGVDKNELLLELVWSATIGHFLELITEKA